MGVAGGAIDAQAGPEADEIGDRGNALVGHRQAIRAREHKGNIGIRPKLSFEVSFSFVAP